MTVIDYALGRVWHRGLSTGAVCKQRKSNIKNQLPFPYSTRDSTPRMVDVPTKDSLRMNIAIMDKRLAQG